MRVILEHKEPINHNITTFWFRPPGRVDYTAGQFIEMTLPHKNPDERGIKHWFTLSSSPSEPLVSITTKYVDDRGSSFKRTLFSLKPGDEIQMSDPMGDFVLPKDKTIPLVFVAGGIGVTPFHSMVKWLIDTKETRDIQVILAAATPKDTVFKELFESYAIKPIVVISKAPPSWKGETGQLTGQRILALIGGAHGKRLYISGPEPMVEALEKDIENLGVSKDQFVGDFFPGYSKDLS